MTTIAIGTLATYRAGSDCYPYEVVAVAPSGHSVTLREMSARAISGSGHDGSAEYEITSCPTGHTIEVTRRGGKYPGYYRVGQSSRWASRIHFGRARYYRDPSF